MQCERGLRWTALRRPPLIPFQQGSMKTTCDDKGDNETGANRSKGRRAGHRRRLASLHSVPGRLQRGDEVPFAAGEALAAVIYRRVHHIGTCFVRRGSFRLMLSDSTGRPGVRDIVLSMLYSTYSDKGGTGL